MDEGCPVPGKRHNTRDSSGITQHAQVRGSRLNEILIKPEGRAERRERASQWNNGYEIVRGRRRASSEAEQPRRDNYIEAAARNLVRKTCLWSLRG